MLNIGLYSINLTVELSRRSVAQGFASFRKERDTRMRSALVICYITSFLCIRDLYCSNERNIISLIESVHSDVNHLSNINILFI